MASPQAENGHTDISNELIDRLATLHMTGNEWMIWWVVLRKTWGWKKKEDRISLSQFQKNTKLSRPAVMIAIKGLVAKSVLVAKTLPLGNEYSLNKDYESWTSSEKRTSSENNFKVVAKTLPSLVAKTLHTKETNTKETITKENTNTNVLVNKLKKIENQNGYGNQDINTVSSYFLEVMNIPKEDCPKGTSRQYWFHLLRESKTGMEGVKWLIDQASQDEFWKNNITSSKDLYYKRIKIIARKRGGIPHIAVMPKEAL